MKKILVLFILAFSCSLFASEWTSSFERENFSAAKNHSEYIRFEVFSTKVGIFTSRVPGYVLKGTASAQLNESLVSEMKLNLKAASLNTDGESRDEKLHSYCLEVEKYPEIIVEIDESIELGQKAVKTAQIKIRGEKKPINVELKVEKIADELVASGEAVLSVSKLEIPDPSIAVAKLEDKINIFFKLKLNSK